MLSLPPFRRLGIVVGGGPAPGINGVISAVTIEADNRNIDVQGIHDGYKWLVKGDTSHTRRLQKHHVAQMYHRGGSMIGTSRTNPTDEELDKVIECIKKMELDALVSIGGDDTALTASRLYKRTQEVAYSLRVAHVPKTIDNDLPLPGLTPTFGFETARHYGVSAVRNLAEDARTTSRWYIIVCMGRAAGHLALGIGKASAATVTIIPEEFGFDDKGEPNTITFQHLCDTILGTIIKRIENKKNYGVIVLAEGLIELVKEELRVILDKTFGKYGTYQTDEFNHLRMGEIEFGKLIRDLLSERLLVAEAKKPPLPQRLHEILGRKPTPYGHDVKFISKDLGYELRSADPIPFDAEYTRDLGYGAVKFLLSEESTKYGAVITFQQGNLKPMKLDDMIDETKKKMRTRHVNIKGESFEVARRYMIRLQKRDFENLEMLGNLARVAGMKPEEFCAAFDYLVRSEPELSAGPCATCNGSGMVKCASCDGTGSIG